jgi:hypothetical protein
MKVSMKAKNEKLIRYSIQLIYLARLLESKLINDTEFSLIKKQLMSDYSIISDILARNDSVP